MLNVLWQTDPDHTRMWQIVVSPMYLVLFSNKLGTNLAVCESLQLIIVPKIRRIDKHDFLFESQIISRNHTIRLVSRQTI